MSENLHFYVALSPFILSEESVCQSPASGSFHFYFNWYAGHINAGRDVSIPYIGELPFLRYPSRSPVKSGLPETIFAGNYLNILIIQLFQPFFCLSTNNPENITKLLHMDISIRLSCLPYNGLMLIFTLYSIYLYLANTFYYLFPVQPLLQPITFQI